MRYHFTQVRMATIKKSTNNKCWRGFRVKGTLLHCFWESKLIQPLWKTVWRFLKNLGIKPPYEPAIPLFGTYPVHFSSVAQSCWTLCDSMDCSAPGLSVHHQLQEFTQTHVHCLQGDHTLQTMHLGSHIHSLQGDPLPTCTWGNISTLYRVTHISRCWSWNHMFRISRLTPFQILTWGNMSRVSRLTPQP